MGKEIFRNTEARKKMFQGLNFLADTVKITLGAAGRNVMIHQPYYAPHATKDGVTVAKSITFDDALEDMGASLAKQAATKTVEQAGDGTSTAVLLTQAIIREGLKSVEAGANPMEIKKGIEKAAGAVTEYIKSVSHPVNTNETIKQIATISANNDEYIGGLIADVIEKIGRDGIIEIAESKNHETTIQVVEGMEFDRGYISHFFVTNQERMQCEQENVFILLYEGKISAMAEISDIINAVHQKGHPLLIIAEDVEGEALAVLTLNKIKSGLKVCAMRSPEFGQNKKEVMEDIAAVTGGTFLSIEKGMRLEQVKIEQLGTAAKSIITKDKCTIIGGTGLKELIDTRAASILIEAEGQDNEHVKNKMLKRAAALKNGVAVLSVGAATESEVKEKRDRVDDAKCATKAAIQEGFVAGGGSCFLLAAKNMGNPSVEGEDEKTGVKILLKAIEEPFRQILANGGIDAGSYIKDIQEKGYGYGVNVKTGVIENLLDTGVIDPTKVLRVALQNAVSAAGVFLTTDATISEKQTPNNNAGLPFTR